MQNYNDLNHVQHKDMAMIPEEMHFPNENDGQHLDEAHHSVDGIESLENGLEMEKELADLHDSNGFTIQNRTEVNRRPRLQRHHTHGHNSESCKLISERQSRPWYSFALVAFSLCITFYAYISYIFIHIVPLFTYYNHDNLRLTFFKSLSGFIKMALLHIIFQLGMVSYLRTIFNDPGSVPNDWKIPDRTMLRSKMLLRKLPLKKTTEKSIRGTVRICRVCAHQKPDRTHHCSSCQRCVLRMDHHCPWVNNCVGFYNHKFFILFIFWLVVGAAFVDITLIPDIIGIFVWKSVSNDTMIGFSQLNALWVFFMSFFFGFSLSFFLLFHVKIILWNETTLETMDFHSNLNGNPYDVGFLKNWQSIFGQNWKYWLIPTRYSISGDGTTFEIYEGYTPV